MKPLSTIISALARCLDYVARVGMLALMLLVVGNVVGRYGWTSIKGAYDYVQLILLVSVASATAYCTLERGHIEISVLMERLSERVQNIVGVLGGLSSVGLFAILSWQCVVVAKATKGLNETSMTVYIPIYPFYWLLSITFGLTALAILPFIAKRAGELFCKGPR